MKIELNISQSFYDTFYRDDTVFAWQSFWNRLCRMSYLREGVVNKLAVHPSEEEDNAYYSKQNAKNYNDISLDYSWKRFCENHNGDVMVVPELEELYVPETLFVCAGVWSWFAISFPNCKITYWA